MGVNTTVKWRELFIYQVYVRNHTQEGTFSALVDDLDRIRDLGVDVIYLLPIHEIGVVKRKGTLGSPYAIKDYYAVNHELGTIEDFKRLVDEIHKRNMKVMMDIVFNHTSPDSVLIEQHPEYFYRNEAGAFANRVGEWWDITDLDYKQDAGLTAYLIEVLAYWTKLGVDGYRFDVASFLPLGFLKEAHAAVSAIDEDTIWLTESVHGGFLRMFRNKGFEALSESELYQVFDIAYDYDVHPEFEAYFKKEGTLEAYKDALLAQEFIYPQNYVKLRNLENHDFGRIANKVKDADKLKNWHAFSFFSKGATMIFGGGEYSATHHPSLFDKDPLSRDGENLSGLIRTCATLVKDDLFSSGVYNLSVDNGVLIGSYVLDNRKAIGVFNVSKAKGFVQLDLSDGVYENLLNGEMLTVENGKLNMAKAPIYIII